MKRSTIAALLIALIGTGMVTPIYGQLPPPPPRQAPAPAPSNRTIVLPQTTQVVAPAPVVTGNGQIATAPVTQTITTPTLVTVPTQAPPTGIQAPGATPTARAPAPAEGVTALTTPTPNRPATAPSTVPPTPGAGPVTVVGVPGGNGGGTTTAPAQAPSTTPTPTLSPANGPNRGPPVVQNPALVGSTVPGAPTTSGGIPPTTAPTQGPPSSGANPTIIGPTVPGSPTNPTGTPTTAPARAPSAPTPTATNIINPINIVPIGPASAPTPTSTNNPVNIVPISPSGSRPTAAPPARGPTSSPVPPTTSSPVPSTSAPTTAPGTNRPSPAGGPTAPTTTPAAGGPVRGPTPAPSTTPAATAPSTGGTVTPQVVPQGVTVAPSQSGIPGAQRIAVAPAPAVPPSESGFYNTTIQANNATGTMNTEQSQQLAGQVQSYLNSAGISTGVAVVGQSVGGSSSTAGRRLQQSSTTIVLDINLSIGPCSPTQAARIRVLLNGLQCNLGTIVVVVVVVFVPVPVYYPPPPVIVQPPVSVAPQLSTTVIINVVNIINIQGYGTSVPSQPMTGGTTINQITNNNVTNIGGPTINNVVNNVNSGNIVNINSGNSVTNNIVQNINTNLQTPGMAAPTTPTPTTPTVPGTPNSPAPPTSPTPGGVTVNNNVNTNVNVATSLTYITPAAVNATLPPVASPPPGPPPSCGPTQPQCRIFTRDMLCCQNEGILTPFQGAQIEILCTHAVRFAITCLATSGPTNISAASVYNNDYGYNYNFRTNINWLGQAGGYLGKVGVDVEPARLDPNRPECSLNLQTPCDYNGNLVTTMPVVDALTFSVIDFNSFYQSYVGFPPTNAIGQFSYSWMNFTAGNPGNCLEQPTLTVPGSFFLGGWPQQEGYAYPCNAAATYGALQQVCPNVGAQAQTGVPGIQPQA